MRRCLLIVVLTLSGICTGRTDVAYNRDVLPILANKCFACHGTDAAKRKAKLRLDVKEVAYAERDGVRAIVPGMVEESELIARILSSDEEEVMPPSKEEKPLTLREKELLWRWIAEGAKYEKHWAYQVPVKGAVPDSAGWGVNAIDAFAYGPMTMA